MKKMSKLDLVERGKQLQDLIDSGKIKDKMVLRKLQMRINHVNFRLRNFKPAKQKIPTVAETQGILPNFLNELDTVQFKELIRERLFKRVDEVIDKKLEEIFKTG